MIAISSQSPGVGVRAWETSLELREFCGNRSCSVVLRRANRNGASLGRLLNLKLILSGAASS